MTKKKSFMRFTIDTKVINSKIKKINMNRFGATGKITIKSLFLLLLLGCPGMTIPFNSGEINNSPKEVIDQVWQIVFRDYMDSSGEYDPKEWLKLRKSLLAAKYPTSELSYEAIRGMLLILKDPYTRFLTPKEFNEMRIDTTGELTGVGIQISLDEETKDLVVISPIEGTPAFKAGIKEQDVIKTINNKPTKGMSIEEAVKLIRGKNGTKVFLGIIREGKLIEIELTRERIAIQAVDSHINKTKDGFFIGYIRLKQFNANASREMKQTIKSLEKSNVIAYVLDLRGNPGGLLESSIEIARQWINKGVIVSTKTKDGINDIRRANGTALTKNPVVVLVNNGSASASEILSGAIKDNERGILVGEKTFGKGLVQSVRGLSDGSGLTVTVAKYLTPNGNDINKNGIVPNIKADFLKDKTNKIGLKDLGTKKDNQYVVAETELVRKLKNSKTTLYKSNSTNLESALN